MEQILLRIIASILQQQSGSNSIYCPGLKSFKFRVHLNAFTTGTEGLNAFIYSVTSLSLRKSSSNLTLRSVCCEAVIKGLRKS